jgi:hypothetical protein
LYSFGSSSRTGAGGTGVGGGVGSGAGAGTASGAGFDQNMVDGLKGENKKSRKRGYCNVLDHDHEWDFPFCGDPIVVFF